MLSVTLHDDPRLLTMQDGLGRSDERRTVSWRLGWLPVSYLALT